MLNSWVRWPLVAAALLAAMVAFGVGAFAMLDDRTGKTAHPVLAVAMGVSGLLLLLSGAWLGFGDRGGWIWRGGLALVGVVLARAAYLALKPAPFGGLRDGNDALWIAGAVALASGAALCFWLSLRRRPA